jgi:hypothetical protein
MDNEDITMLPKDMFLKLIDVDLQQRIAMADDLDSNIADALKLLLDNRPTNMTSGLNDWMVEQAFGWNILFYVYKGKNYIPKNMELRRDIVQSFHDHETAGHPEELGTYNAVGQHYWWPGLRHLCQKLRARLWYFPTI